MVISRGNLVRKSRKQFKLLLTAVAAQGAAATGFTFPAPLEYGEKRCGYQQRNNCNGYDCRSIHNRACAII